jgi:hypothetical protein
MFFFPVLTEQLLSLLAHSSLEASTIERTSGTRLIGWGIAFFDAGITNSYVLILIAILFRNNKFNTRYTFFYLFSFIIIFLIGMMIARTTIIGFCLAMFIFFYKNNILVISLYRIKKLILSFLFIFIIGLFIFFFLNDELIFNFLILIDFGFEMFINYFLSNELSTGSTNAMLHMYIFPTNFKTWLIGDAMFLHPFIQDRYYMDTDIGFVRLIFYSGILGCIIYIISQAMLLIQASKNASKKYKLFFYLAFILFLILNFKGLSSLVSLIIPFYFLKSVRD